jgi:hypothetical protein
MTRQEVNAWLAAKKKEEMLALVSEVTGANMDKPVIVHERAADEAVGELEGFKEEIHDRHTASDALTADEV